MLREPPTPVRPFPPPRRRGVRRWRDEFRQATRGIKLGMRGHSRFAVHFFASAAALAACVALECRIWEWGLVLLCIGGVFTAELFNSAIVSLYRSLEPDHRPAWTGPLNVSAGAVLTMSFFAGLVGALVFVRRLGELMGWWA
jgi:diacylglycerol kinase